MKHKIIEAVNKIKNGVSIVFGYLTILVVEKASIYLSPEKCVYLGNKLVDVAKRKLDASDEFNIDETWLYDIYTWGKVLQMYGEKELRGENIDMDDFIKELSIHMTKVKMML